MHQDMRDDMRVWDMLEGGLGCSQYGATANDWKALLKVFAVQMPSAVEEREVGAVEGRASYIMESREACTEAVETPEGFSVWVK